MQAKFVDEEGKQIILRIPPGTHSIPMTLIEFDVKQTTPGKIDVFVTYQVDQKWIDDTKSAMFVEHQPEPLTQEQKVESRKRWDARYEEGQNKS